MCVGRASLRFRTVMPVAKFPRSSDESKFVEKKKNISHQPTAMAKSTRSKVKRSFRSKKRESGVYAATEAARLQRLNTKLQLTIQDDQGGETDVDPIEATADNPGWSWFVQLGMLDSSDVTLDNLSNFPSHSSRIWEGATLLDSLFPQDDFLIHSSCPPSVSDH